MFVILFLSSAFFPYELMLEPAGTIAEYNPVSFIVEGVRDPVISTLTGEDALKAFGSIIGIVGDQPGAQRGRPSSPAEDGRMTAAAIQAGWPTVTALVRRSANELLRVPGAAIPGVLAPTIFFLGLTAVFGKLTNLRGFATDSYQSFLIPVSHAPGRGLHRRRDRRQPRPRHRARLVRPPVRLPRATLGAPGRACALGVSLRALVPATVLLAVAARDRRRTGPGSGAS